MPFAQKFLVLLCVFSFYIFFSCSSSNRIEGYVYYRLNANPTTLDPALIVDVPAASIAAKLFNGLVKLDDNLNVIPDIAEKWEISGDGLRYKFFLKKGVRFSNGREVKASDFKYSFERVLNPKTKSPNTWVFDKVEGAKEFLKGVANEAGGFRVIDEYAFEIRLSKPFSPFLSMLTMTPAYVVAKEDAGKGTGPFILKDWLPNREVVLKRNEDYFGGKPKIKGMVYRVIPEDLTAITEFELGNIDVISLPASAYSKFRNDKKWNKHIVSLKGLNTYYLGMNSSRPPFDNANIRRAVSYAVDRKKILETFYEGRGRPAAGVVPEMLRKWEIEDIISYNPDKAKEIIKKQGPGRIRANMYVTADQDVIDLAEIIQAYLSEVGIDVKIKQLEWSAYKDAVNNGEHDMFWLSWWADYPDAENFLFPLFHSSNLGPAGNRTRYANKDVDSLIEKGQYALNEKERNGFYKKAEEIIVQDSPWVPFWHRTDFLVKQPWIKGFREYLIYSIDKGTGIEIIKQTED
jgi:peptide/nickel transport system substrate-binding protein/oligopeptide transport system substrate-binding protein